jgi:hypothetical protein
VIRRRPGFQIDIAEQTARLPILAPVRPTPASVGPPPPNYQITHPPRDFLSSLLDARIGQHDQPEEHDQRHEVDAGNADPAAAGKVDGWR